MFNFFSWQVGRCPSSPPIVLSFYIYHINKQTLIHHSPGHTSKKLRLILVWVVKKKKLLKSLRTASWTKWWDYFWSWPRWTLWIYSWTHKPWFSFEVHNIPHSYPRFLSSLSLCEPITLCLGKRKSGKICSCFYHVKTKASGSTIM